MLIRFEGDETLDTESERRDERELRESARVLERREKEKKDKRRGGRKESDSLRNENRDSIPETPDHERFLSDLNDLPFPHSTLLQSKADIELHTRSTSLLSHSMTTIDVLEDLLDVLFRSEGGVEGSVADSC